MKRSICFACVLITVLSVSVCLAESDIPDLVGTWTVKGEGGVIIRGDKPGPTTHYKDGFGSLDAEAVVTKQQGRIMHGIFKSPSASEKFIAAIGPDNTTIYYADQDGFIDGKIINKDTIEVVYRQVTSVDTVVAVGIWTRKK